MLTRSALALLCAAAAMWSFATGASACACCASTGQRQVETGKPSSYDAGELSRVAFDGKAQLLTGEADAAEIRGLSATTSDYMLEVARQSATWTFTFKTDGAVAGTLTFAPDKLAKFAVDTRNSDSPADGTVTLYKEWKQTAPVKGTGMFKLAKDSSLSLILQGRGNGCSTAEDFTHWSLVAQGDGFNFLFFGNLAKPR